MMQYSDLTELKTNNALSVSKLLAGDCAFNERQNVRRTITRSTIDETAFMVSFMRSTGQRNLFISVIDYFVSRVLNGAFAAGCQKFFQMLRMTNQAYF